MKDSCFPPGSRVRIKSIQATGTVVDDPQALSDRKAINVRVGNLNYQCQASDLVLLAPPRDESKPHREGGRRWSSFNQPSHRPPEERELDLHGFSIQDAVEQLELALSRAITEGQERLIVIHGSGTGKLREEIHANLRKQTVVRSFQVMPTNRGATVVYFWY